MASDSVASLTAGEGEDPKLKLDRDRLVLDQQRLELEKSWPRKWGTIAVSVAVPLSVTLIGYFSNWQADAQRKAETGLAEKHKITEENRSALELYLKYISDKAPGGESQIKQIEAISSLSNDATFRAHLYQQIRTIQALEPRSTPGQEPPQSQAPSTILSGTTNDKLTQAAAKEADFTTYIQYYELRGGEAKTVSDALQSMRYSVPGLQRMDASHSPRHNQIRFYLARQKQFAKNLATQLKGTTGLEFEVVGPVGNNLPDGVLEIWLGKN